MVWKMALISGRPRKTLPSEMAPVANCVGTLSAAVVEELAAGPVVASVALGVACSGFLCTPSSRSPVVGLVGGFLHPQDECNIETIARI
jgi:hypothetical protein